MYDKFDDLRKLKDNNWVQPAPAAAPKKKLVKVNSPNPPVFDFHTHTHTRSLHRNIRKTGKVRKLEILYQMTLHTADAR